MKLGIIRVINRVGLDMICRILDNQMKCRIRKSGYPLLKNRYSAGKLKFKKPDLDVQVAVTGYPVRTPVFISQIRIHGRIPDFRQKLISDNIWPNPYTKAVVPCSVRADALLLRQKSFPIFSQFGKGSPDK